MTEKFSVIVEDPAWQFDDDLPGKSRGASRNYMTMDIDDLCRMISPIEVADDAHLLMWRVSAMQQEALDLVKARGFIVKSELVWLKRTKTGKRHFGMGRHVRLEHEVCLICTRGRGAPRLSKAIRSTFTTELYLDDDGGGSFEAKTGIHSQKPDEFYQIVDELFGGHKAELFARQRRPGWSSFGNELTEDPTTMTVEDDFG